MMNITYREYALLIKKNLKLIIILAIVVGGLVGSYKYIKGMKSVNDSEISGKEVSDYNEQLQIYEKEKVDIEEVLSDMETYIASAYSFANENPIMKLDSSNCSYTLLTIDFSDPQAYRDDTIRSIINNVDSKELFGSSDELLNKYKSDIAFVKGSSGEVTVYIYNVGSIDTEQTAQRLARIISSADSIKDSLISEHISSMQGGCQFLYNRQREIRNNAFFLQYDLRQMKEQERMIEAPSIDSSTPSSEAVIKTSIKYAVAGALLGAIIGILLVLFKITQGGTIISCEQIDELFDLDYIGDLSRDERHLELLKANLRTVSKGKGSVMIIDKTGYRETETLIRDLNNMGEGKGTEFVKGVDIAEDKGTIDRITNADSIVLVISKGVTRIDDIQRQLKRSSTLGTRVLGYILSE